MAVQIYETAITPEQETLLPGLGRMAEWALWVFPDDFSFEADEIAQLAEAFGDLRGIVWYSSGVAHGKHKGRVRDIGSAFGESPFLAKELVTQTTTEYMLYANKLYSGVAWLSPDGYGELAALLSPSTGGSDSTFSFIPYDSSIAEDWRNIVSGLEWLRHCNSWIADEPEPKLESEAILLSYIGLTVKIGGVAGLLTQSIDSDVLSKTSMVFYGSRTILQQAGEQLRAGAPAIPASLFTRWLKRGAQYKAIY